MSDTPATDAPTPGPVSVPWSPPASQASYDWNAITKYVAGFLLAGSVLFLVINGQVSADTYLAVIVAPGLAALGIHAAATSSKS